MIDLAERCDGTGEAPRYRSEDTWSFELVHRGDPWRHRDGALGFGTFSDREAYDVQLETGTYDITAEAVELRSHFSLRGRRSGFGNPNGEYPPRAGTLLRFATNGLRIGRPSRIMQGVDDRVGLPTIEHLGLYRDPLQSANDAIGQGAAIWLDEPSDQFTLNHVNVSGCTFGLLSTTAVDAVRIRALHTARVAFPLYFETLQNWYVTVTDCCFADGDGPCLIQGKHHPWSFQNVLIVRQGRAATHLPACNIIWNANNGSYLGGNIEDPGKTFGFSDGAEERHPAQIDADGMRLAGNNNHIATHFKGASGPGRANLRLMSGASGNIVQSRFSGSDNGAVDLIIDEGCEANVVHVMPGMHIRDDGRNTCYIGRELAGSID